MRINKLLIILAVVLTVIISATLAVICIELPDVILDKVQSNTSLYDSSAADNDGIKKSKSVFADVIIYNGTSVEDGIKSNAEINRKADEIVKDISGEREKAKALYEWVGSNIKYDNYKAEKVLDKSDNNQEMPESGAIAAFEEKKGICFDKACLYAAMAKHVGLKVRLISGNAYDGEKYVGHAWNQVYVKNEDEWLNIDTTFYEAGDYFDTTSFNRHKVQTIAGEW